MEEAFNQLKKEFNSLRVSFTECRTEFALSKCKSDEKTAELHRQVTALKESNLDLVRRVNALSPQKVVAPWDKTESKSGIQPESLAPKIEANKNDPIDAVDKHRSTDKPKTKDWNAICRELSDDEEEEENKTVPEKYPEAKQSTLEKIQQRRPDIPEQCSDLIECFIMLFQSYIDAMRHWSIEPLETYLAVFGQATNAALRESFSGWKHDSPEFMALAQAILRVLPETCELETVCWGCSVRLLTPVNLLDHLIEPAHVTVMEKADGLYQFPATIVQHVLAGLHVLLKRTYFTQREAELKDKGEALYRRLNNDSCLRSTEEFYDAKWDEYLSEAYANDEKAIELFLRREALEPEDDKYRMKLIRKWIRSNHHRVIQDLEEHLSTGVAHCPNCHVAYTSKADYFKHVTSYHHASTDQGNLDVIDYIVRLARGEQDWDITM